VRFPRFVVLLYANESFASTFSSLYDATGRRRAFLRHTRPQRRLLIPRQHERMQQERSQTDFFPFSLDNPISFHPPTPASWLSGRYVPSTTVDGLGSTGSAGRPRFSLSPPFFDRFNSPRSTALVSLRWHRTSTVFYEPRRVLSRSTVGNFLVMSRWKKRIGKKVQTECALVDSLRLDVVVRVA
jgi:hypothetical protein